MGEGGAASGHFNGGSSHFCSNNMLATLTLLNFNKVYFIKTGHLILLQ